MATGTASFSGNAFKFDISYEYTNTSFKITSIKTTALQDGWGVWELQPSLFTYILKGSDPVPKAYQSYDANGTTCKQFVTDHGGIWQLAYNGNNPGAYLPNTKGTSVTWNAEDFNKLNMSLSGSSATITIGAFIANTSGTLSNAAWGFDTISFTLYTAIDGYELVVDYVDTTSISVKHSWTNGSVAGSNYPERSITVKAADNSYTKTETVASGTTIRFYGLQPNRDYVITGVANDGTTKLTATINKATNAAEPDSINITPTTNSLVMQANSKNHTVNLSYKYILNKLDGTKETKDAVYNQPVTFSFLTPNTNYALEVIAYNNKTINTSPGNISNTWTKPMITNSGLVLTLPKDLEHSKINVLAVADVASLYDEYSFKLNLNAYSAYNKANIIQYNNLTENTNFQITVKLRNTKSGLESDPISKTITTWYSPLTNLSVLLNNKWFWYLDISSSYTYNGSISKYEFSIGSEPYVVTGTNNKYTKGTIVGGNARNLKYNSDYVCKVRVTDNHGRTYEAAAIYRTLDERCIYINGLLKEIKLVNKDASITYITPNMLSVIKPDGTLVNMNKIINNDSRTSFQ